jgi:hypothetical protein
MPKPYEYNEGKWAQENFEKAMKALFQVPDKLGDKRNGFPPPALR